MPHFTGQQPSADAADAGALAELFRQYHSDLVRLATMVVGNRETAEDVVQDVFVGFQALSARQGDPESPLPYLRAAVLNRCRSVLRRQVVARRFGTLRDVDYGLAQLSAEADAIRAQERREVLAALASLPARRRDVLVLRYYLGLSEAEIASTLGISQGSVKSAAARGIAALARKLGEDS